VTDLDTIREMLKRTEIPFTECHDSTYSEVKESSGESEYISLEFETGNPDTPKIFGYSGFVSNWFFSKKDGRLLAIANWE
jgi:hypothetical protein